MTKLAFQGQKNDIDEIRSQLQDQGIEHRSYLSDGFDGATIVTIVLDLVEMIVPPTAAVLAAKVATKKQIQIKVNGIEVNANSEEEALRIIKDLSTSERTGE